MNWRHGDWPARGALVSGTGCAASESTASASSGKAPSLPLVADEVEPFEAAVGDAGTEDDVFAGTCGGGAAEVKPAATLPITPEGAGALAAVAAEGTGARRASSADTGSDGRRASSRRPFCLLLLPRFPWLCP